jgi:hypothetical protein
LVDHPTRRQRPRFSHLAVAANDETKATIELGEFEQVAVLPLPLPAPQIVGKVS